MSSSLQTADDEAPTRSRGPDTSGTRAATITDRIFRNPVLGPLGALIILVIGFSIFTENFASVDNTSLILQQSVVVGTLALGQTIIILTGGIDLANGAIMVLGSLVMAKLALGDTGAAQFPAILAGVVVCGGLGLISGLLISRLLLPPFIVTLGMLDHRPGDLTAVLEGDDPGRDGPVDLPVQGRLPVRAVPDHRRRRRGA